MSYNPSFGNICNPDSKVKKVATPYIGDITAGKNTYVYDAHTYHTKVPPEGIELLINHYTSEGDVVLDPFCGSGMTGVAAQRTNRKVLLSDLSPAATFIAHNINTPIDADKYWSAIRELLKRAEPLKKRLYTTHCRECGKEAEILYTVWSYKLICNHCGQEFVLWDVARDERETVKESKIRTEFNCPHCAAWLKKRQLKRTELVPVAIGYKCCSRSLKERVCELTGEDLQKLLSITYDSIPKELWYPTDRFPKGVNTNQPISCGIDSIDKAYFPRSLWAFAFLWKEAERWPEADVREKLLFTLTSLYQRVTKFSEFRFWGGSGNIANYNVPQIINEQNVFSTFERKAKTIWLYFNSETRREVNTLQISTQSACHLSQISNDSVDYVFTDPPFGANINYSEMNFLWESWLREFTDVKEEAIVNKVQHKSNEDYGELMRQALTEINRVLKPNGWLTLMFHNSSDRIWQELQRAITTAGFQIEGTVLFDKVHGTFKQFVSENAVGNDLLLNCRKKSGDKAEGSIQLVMEEFELVQARSFVIKQIADKGKAYYMSHYEHVSRKEEFNYRKLYSEWLASIVGSEIVAVDFEKFRLLANAILEEKQNV